MMCYGQQASFSVKIFAPVPPVPPIPPAPTGYVVLENDEDNDMNRADLVMVSPSQVGFWVILPSGRCVLHCRAMKYDKVRGEWYYGPWHEDHNMSYEKYRHSSFYNRNFHDYMNERYPKYYERHFKDERRDDRDRDHDKRFRDDRNDDKKWHDDKNDKKWHDRDRDDHR